MGEVAALASAFDIEFDKALAALPSITACPTTNHDAHLSHYRAAQRMAELVSHYAVRLPEYASIHRILQAGDRLVKRQEHRLAWEACYSYVQGLSLHTKEVPRMEPLTRLSNHVQACFGCVSCETALVLEQDPNIKHPDTLKTLVHGLSQLRDSLVLVVPSEELYWLTLNGTVHVYKLAKRLMTAGFVQQMLPYLVFCVKALEPNVVFSTPRHLPWRTQLYITLCYAYCDIKSYDAAKSLVQEGISNIEGLIKLQRLDPVPALPHVQAAYKTAKAMLHALKLKLEVLTGAAPAALQPIIQEVAVTEKAKLTALLEALQVPGRRVIRHEAVSGPLKELFVLARQVATPVLAELKAGLQKMEAALAAPPAVEGAPAPADGGAPPAADAAAVPVEPAPLPPGPPPQAEEFSIQLHKAFLCIAYNFEQPDFFQELLEVAQLRLKLGANGDADATAVSVLSALVTILDAVAKLEKFAGAESLAGMVQALQDSCAVAAAHSSDILTDASLMLYMTARPLLDGVFCMADKEAKLVASILRCLHACFNAVDLDDSLLRANASIKLALLLEEQGQLYEARSVLCEARDAITRARSEAMAATRHAEDEHLRWITASRNQPRDALAALVKRMPDSEQELACLHVDLLALLYRVELEIGVLEQQDKANTKQTRLIQETERREAASNVYGVRTMKEKRLDEAKIQAAAQTPSNPPLKERELMQSCGKNLYEKALLLMQMAPFQADKQKQAQLLQEAADALAKAQGIEDTLFTAAQPDLTKGRTTVPLQPRILQRTATSVTLSHFPLALKGGKKAVKFTVYGKSFGAGVALSINKTSMEYPGSGMQYPLDSDVTIEGLQHNDTYVFALAAYDETGQLIGGLGSSSPELLIALPLPLYMCWAHLVIMASRLRLWGLARRATQVVVPHFVVTLADRPLWQANPMDTQTINRFHLDAACKPLLRAFAQAVYIYTGAILDQELATVQGANAAMLAKNQAQVVSLLRAPYLEEQIARLKSCKRLLMALEVSALLRDDMLVEEGAIRVYHMLGPLLQLKDKSDMLHKALAAAHMALQDVSNLVQNSLEGQEGQRELGSRVAGCVSYHLVALSLRAAEAQAAAYFGKLNMELMKAYDPRFAISGRPANSALLEEAAAAQELLLLQPQSPQWGAPALQERAKDDKDFVARALPLIAAANPMDAWNVLGREDALEHPRWVELVVQMLEAGVRKGQMDNLAAYAQQVTWHVKQALKVPAVEFERWKLEEAVAALQSVALAPEDEPLKPSTEDLSPEAKAEAEAEYGRAREAALLRARRRLAAVVLLQRRLPALFKRRREVLEIRRKAKAWQPWLARLQLGLGLVMAQEGRLYLQIQAQAAKDAEAAAAAGGQDGDKPPTPTSPTKPGSPTKPPGSPTGKGKPSSPPSSARKGGKTTPVPPAEEGPVTPPPIKALEHLARASQQALRGGAWHELLNSARQAWNVCRALLNAESSLTAPTPLIEWVQADPPQPPQAPDNLILPTDPKAGGKGGKAAPPKKEEPKKAPPAKADKGKKGAAEPAAPPPLKVWIAKNSVSNTGRCLRSITQALLGLVDRLRSGTPLHTGVIPLVNAAQGGPERPATAVSAAASSKFSFGSDLQAELWFQGGPVDMEWVNKFVAMALQVMLRMQRWHTLVETGQWWLVLCEGVYNEKVLPYLMQAAPRAHLDVAPLQASLEVVMRDKNQALDQLDKVRLLVRERLGTGSLLSEGVSHKVRKKRKVAATSLRPGTAGSHRSHDTAGGGSSVNDNASLVSAYTYRTASTFKTHSQPDFTRIPAEYEKVIEVLKKRGEKGAMVMAMNEMGDVHAHFGNWGGATTAWNDALDTIIGPYQVLKSWRKALDPLGPPQLLQAYGVHGLLLAGCTLLGKLARYSYYDNMQMRLEACRMAAVLLNAVFCSNISHPQRPLGFATYVPRELWDNVDIFKDPYKCNVSDLLSGLETVASVLLEQQLALEALPVIVLWEHVAYHISRQLHTTVVCRLARVEALCQLGQLSQACGVLLGLIGGRGLPDPVLDSDYVVKAQEDGSVVQVDLPPAPLSNRFMPGHPSNKAAVLFLAEAPLHPALDALYGSWAVAHLNLARAGLLLRLGGMPNVWKMTDPSTGLKVTPDKPLPEALEPSLLQKAYDLLQRALDMAAGRPTVQELPTGKDAKKGGKAPAKPASPKGKKPAAAEEPTSPKPSMGKQTDERTTMAQRAEVQVRALLLLSELELLRWQPLKALGQAQAALAYLAENADNINVFLPDNDDTERFALSPALWFKVRLQLVRCSVQLAHIPQAYTLIDQALADAAHVNEQLTCNMLRHVRARLLQGEGHTADALNMYDEVITRYLGLGIRDLRVAAALLDEADLRDQLGLRQDSGQLYQHGMQVLCEWSNQLGLKEMQEHPELSNLYTPGLLMFCEGLMACARAELRAHDLLSAQQEVSLALQVLRTCTRCLPSHQAAAAFTLARILRNTLLGDVPLPQDLQVDRVQHSAEILSRCQELLLQVLTLAGLDGGHPRDMLRAALCELACLAVAGGHADRAAACLKLAHGAANRQDLLLMSSHLLQPVAVAQMPEWAVALAKGQEQHFLATHGKPADTPISDPDVGRLLVRLLLALSQARGRLSQADKPHAEAQLMALHTALKAACPKYASDACFPDVPIPAEPAPKPPAGTVIVQWYIQDGLWQVPQSWQAGGSLPYAKLSDHDIINLQPVPSYASMLFYVASGEGARCGELTFEVAAVRKLQNYVKKIRQRLESPRAPTDLWGYDTPTEEELQHLRGLLEFVLSKRKASDDELSSTGGGSHPASPLPWEGAPRHLTASGDVPPANLLFLQRMEALLSVENGVELVDAELAGWLDQTLPDSDR